MRIIGGRRKGALIKAPRNLPVRPITDRSKESLFNILWNVMEFEGLTVLDLFSGTGSMTLEFASRDAELVVSVDQDPRCVKFINSQVERFAFEQVDVRQSDVMQFIGGDYRQYDLIFADPPFAFPKYREMTELVFECGLLKPDGYFITEHYKKTDLDDLPYFEQKRKYGQTNLSFFRYSA